MAMATAAALQTQLPPPNRTFDAITGQGIAAHHPPSNDGDGGHMRQQKRVYMETHLPDSPHTEAACALLDGDGDQTAGSER